MEDGFFRKITIVGVGLIGGSIGLNLKNRANPPRVTGLGRRESSLRKALECQAVDEITTSLAEAVEDSDLIVLCTPVGKIIDYIGRLSQVKLPDNCLLTDAGSVKGAIVDTCLKKLPVPGRFVAAHPMAGSENSGVEHATADLFKKTTCFITLQPGQNENDENVLKVKSFWQSLGSVVIRKNPDEHDRMLARSSHLSHILAPAFVRLIKNYQENTDPEINNALAGSFRDITRVAGSSPALWCDIFSANKENTVAAIEDFSFQLEQLKNYLVSLDSGELTEALEEARKFRDSIYNEKE